MHGKIMVVTFSDSEEHIIQKIMDVLMVEPVMAHPLEKSLTSNILTSPNLEIRINEQTVYHDNHSVPLTHHEFFTLLYLAQHPSWVLSKEQIYEAVWKADPEQCGAAANVVYSLRWKIGDTVMKLKKRIRELESENSRLEKKIEELTKELNKQKK